MTGAQVSIADGRLDVWATARGGFVRIRLFDAAPADKLEVYALRGHDLLPMTKTFPRSPAGEAAARAYANELWRSL